MAVQWFGSPALLILTVVVPIGAVEYTIIDLDVEAGPGFQAYGLNNLGHVVGELTLPNGENHAVLWPGYGGLIDLGTLSAGGDSAAQAINDAGVVVGLADWGGPGPWHAFRWTAAEGMADLGTLEGVGSSRAYDINNQGQAVGESDIVGDGRGFVWDSVNGMQALVSSFEDGTSTRANAINDNGQIVGEAETGGVWHPVMWDGGTMIDLGVFGSGYFNRATDMNEAGQVVGYSGVDSGSYRHAFLWEAGELLDLGTLPGSANSSSEAYAINNSGQVVGSSEWRPFLWEDGVMTDLNDLLPEGSEWWLSEVFDINDAGQILGHGQPTGEGPYHRFLMTPIPEPGTLILLAVGGLVRVRRRR